MIAGGVAFISNMLNLVDYFMQFRIVDFLIVIGAAVLAKFVYGLIKPNIKDPITSNPLARRLFFLGMGVLATALVMRAYHMPYYHILLYLDVVIQAGALGVSFMAKPEPMNEEILDS